MIDNDNNNNNNNTDYLHRFQHTNIDFTKQYKSNYIYNSLLITFPNKKRAMQAEQSDNEDRAEQ